MICTMNQADYIILMNSQQSNSEASHSLRKISNVVLLGGSSNEKMSSDLFLITQTLISKDEITSQLGSIPGIVDTSIVSLSQPVKTDELAQVRKVLGEMTWDASNLTDDELSMYLEDKRKGQWTFYLEPEGRKKENGLTRVRMKRLDEHPQYSAEWLKSSTSKSRSELDKRDLADEIEVREITIVTEEEDFEPPPPPVSLKQMTDVEIREWMFKNDTRIRNPDDITIKRTAEDIQLTILINGDEVTLIYKGEALM